MDPFKDFTRGGQLIMHAIRMFWQSIRYVLLFALIFGVSFFLLVFFLKTSAYERSTLLSYGTAQLKIAAQGEQVMHQAKTPQASEIQLFAIHFINNPSIRATINSVSEKSLSALWWSLFCGVGILSLLIYFFKFKGAKQRIITDAKGHSVVPPNTLKKLLIKAQKESDLTLAGVPLLRDSEVQHILFTGSTGTGKSVGMQELMDQVRMRGQRAIVYDIEGSFIATYYRPGKDILLNPLDERSPLWNHWQECQDAADFEAVASSLMPLHLSGTDPFWIHSARTIFASASLRLQIDNKAHNKFLLQPMFTESLGGLASLLVGSVAESLVSEKNEKTALSIKSTLSTYCKALTYLKEDTGGDLFSIRDWIEQDKGDGWLFIASNALKVEALKPLISVWLDVAAKAVLSLSPSLTRRLWFFMDELASLHRLPSLIDTLSRSRKYGGSFVAAIQDIHQLRTIYGQDEAKTLTGLFNTHLCYRTQGPDSAHWMSKIIGGKEVIEKKENYSMGAHEMRDGVSLHQERRREPVVMDLEFLELDDLQAFLRLPGNWPVTKLQFDIKPRTYLEPPLVKRKLEDVLLVEKSEQKSETDTNDTDVKNNKAGEMPLKETIATQLISTSSEKDLNVEHP
jgi:type IV conjugative transfer system coupling protein TraD